MSVLDLVGQIVLQIILTAWVVRRDMRQATPLRLSRSWNDASFWSAVVVFGPLCIPVHFTRTRRTLLGFVIGLLWTAGVVVALWFFDEALSRVFGGV